MKRIQTAERPDWKDKAEQLGFIFHTMYGEQYWDERAYYSFTLEQVENHIEDPSAELYTMCLDVVDRAVRSEELLTKLAIPKDMWDVIATSWHAKDPSLYGRFDLSYDGTSPAKMLEFNADTPTSLYESAYFQWLWLDDKIECGDFPDETDQYNSIQEKLISRFERLFEKGSHIHFSSCKGTDEDRQTVRYIEDCAAQAGHFPHFTYLEDIGVNTAGEFADHNGALIQSLFKLYPWEDMLREVYSKFLLPSDVMFLEPAWKAVLSNKALLPLIWEFNKGHPNLLPASFSDNSEELGSSFVKKPIFSREGANVSIMENGDVIESADGEYGEEGYIYQRLHPLPQFDDNHTVIGSWIVGDEPAGMAIREDKSPITKDLSRFLPHIIEA
ncbi:glutathionylspermidine synthase family protein [Kordiimonas sp. SCSIO 12603]|uniref:glutathionylspermidine synthase family protein n=1 Tax=Kordiimonas sp. SCSIO 12603 TaxID=2829596 RepID=UPI0021066E77|nr:glutathionylspermidine synthase family protein [Kordiimonas sp. SCSIO 12603]UTW59629.1 glutathionylspermidine synthase family protein [Kordiimonas sp. SCSIO 12603]